MIRTILCASLLCFGPLAAADAMSDRDIRRCKAMAATMAPKQAQIAEQKEKRDTLAEIVEAKGDLWEEAEIHRLASSGHAADADAAKQEYEQAKFQLSNSEHALQTLVVQLNQDVAAYNQTCATSR